MQISVECPPPNLLPPGEYLFSHHCKMISPLPFQKGEDEGEGFSSSLVRWFQRELPDLSTPHVSPLLDRGGEEALAAGDATKRRSPQATLHTPRRRNYLSV